MRSVDKPQVFFDTQFLGNKMRKNIKNVIIFLRRRHLIFFVSFNNYICKVISDQSDCIKIDYIEQ